MDYLAHDGTVQHLYPQIADPKDNIAADPPRTISASETLNLGNPAWVIGPPYGTDMIIAVASSRALFDKPRPSNAETAGVYLRDLQAAIDAARQRGDHVAGAATTLEALHSRRILRPRRVAIGSLNSHLQESRAETRKNTPPTEGPDAREF